MRSRDLTLAPKGFDSGHQLEKALPMVCDNLCIVSDSLLPYRFAGIAVEYAKGGHKGVSPHFH